MIYPHARVRVLVFFAPVCEPRFGVVAWSCRPTWGDFKRKADNERR